MRCKHYYYFGEHFNEGFEKNEKGSTKKINKTNWDTLRTDTVMSPFSIENTVSDFEKNCMQKKDYADIAEIICRQMDNRKYKKIVSCGIGKGILEWHIKRLRPQIQMDATDYTEKALEKLQTVWRGHDELYPFDMIQGNWEKLLGYDSVILYRVAEEFDFKTWKRIFGSMKKAGISNIIFVPAGIHNFREISYEIFLHIRNIIRGKRDTLCGCLYSENEFFKMWRGCYEVSLEISYEKTKLYFLNIVN